MHSRFLAAGMAAGALLALPAAVQAAPSPNLVVSQVYGGGSNFGAPYTHDFVELFNRGRTDVPLGGKSIQYTSAAGTGNFGASTTQLTELPAVTLRAGEYLLVQEAGGTVGQPTPANFADSTPINMSATAGKVALANGTTGLGCNGGSTVCDAAQTARIIDLVGYGGANFFETAPTPTLSNSSSAIRISGGCQDTDNNLADFEVIDPPAPRGLQTDLAVCPLDAAPSVASTTPASGATDVPLDSDVSVTFSEPVTTDAEAFSLSCADSGVHTLTVTGGPTTFALEPAGTFSRAEQCTLTVHAEKVHDVDGDDPPDAMGGDTSASFTTLGLELKIREIQGLAHVSPHLDDAVSNVTGVVTARRTRGYFMQDPLQDGNDATSEGIFVFTDVAPAAEIVPGQQVRVSGRVAEFRGAAASLGLTQIVTPSTTVLGAGPAIPAVVLGEGGRVPPNRVIDNDSVDDVDLNPMFDPDEDGIDFYETVEGMKVRVNDPRVVGPTGFGEIPVVGDGGKFAGPFTARGGLQAVADDFNPERIHLDDEVLLANAQRMPLADVRDRLSSVEGVMDYTFNNFKVQVLSPPTLTDGGLEKEVTEAPDDDELSVGSFNVENLTPLGANPSAAQRAKYAALAATLVTRMQAPDIVAVEEIQDNNGTSGGANSPVVDASQTWTDLIGAISAAGGPAYQYRQIDPVAHQDGGAPGGNIRVGFLFRTDRGLEFVDRPGGTSTNAVGVVDTRHGPELTLSPGRIEPGDDAWLASRKPLAGEFRWRGRTLIAVANHFASKGGDDPLFGHLQPPVRHTEIGPDGRHQQATLVNEFVGDVLAADKQARVIVLGDINDFDFSETVDILETDGALTTLFDLLPQNERYSYDFEGNSQVLDQILVSPALLAPTPEYDSVHMNAEFADQTSDHDPQVARIKVTGRNDAAHAASR